MYDYMSVYNVFLLLVQFGRLLTDDVVNWCSTALKDMITDK